MKEVKFEATRISLDGGETWANIKPLRYENYLQEPVHATGGWGNPINISNNQEGLK